jgi:hypothetical protein
MAGLDTAGRIAVGLALAALVSVPADAETIRNWPCEQPLAEHFVPEEVWGGPLPAPLPRDWRGDARVRATVAVAADPENPPDRGQAEIAEFAECLGADRQQALLGVFAGLLEEFDTLRAIAVEGVRDFVVRAKILNESVEDHDAVLAALPAHGGAAVEERRQGHVAARDWDERNLDDALEEAEFLCRRYGYLDRKLRRLTAALHAAW